MFYVIEDVGGRMAINGRIIFKYSLKNYFNT